MEVQQEYAAIYVGKTINGIWKNPSSAFLTSLSGGSHGRHFILVIQRNSICILFGTQGSPFETLMFLFALLY